MAIHPALYSSRSEEWETPQPLFDALHLEFSFDLDAAATAANAKCHRWLGPGGVAEDALNCTWAEHGRHIFCNPPYGRGIGEWFRKASVSSLLGSTVVMLAHARTDTRWWHTHAVVVIYRPDALVADSPGELRYVPSRAWEWRP